MIFSENMIIMKCCLLGLILFLFSQFETYGQETITFGTLINEMTNLERLTYLPDPSYRMIQFSSYDRRSKTPGMEGWFSNSDGFGNEPIPGFEEVLEKPDQDGIGTYLMCDIQGAGAILRLWTAGINGRIRCYLDQMEKPFYEGKAADFFWNTAAELSGYEEGSSFSALFRQFDATYFPVPFSNRCRIEWIGNISEIHFYHIGIRTYEEGTLIRTFRPHDLTEYENDIQRLKLLFSNPDQMIDLVTSGTEKIEKELPGHSQVELLKVEGNQAIDYLSIRIKTADMEAALRKCILSIYFDEAAIPQVQSPLGDFFGAAPGLNPYLSYPLSIQTDSLLVCRFLMPFQYSARIVIENHADETIPLSSLVHITDYDWKEGLSMHFRTRYKIDHGLIASDTAIMDIPYILMQGKGRIVGVAAFVYNPSQAVTSWGNWWGEGDEKIFIDKDIFPSFYGTGSEDYFNYSWSAEQIFSFPYCGQPRNDGPGNRGYVSNFRWHIQDDLFFKDKIAFYMELLHHGVVPDFSYGRIVYVYALPGCADDFVPVTSIDVEKIPYLHWRPEAYLGSAGFQFIEAEKIVTKGSEITIEEGNRWSDGHVLMWKPKEKNDILKFKINQPAEGKFIMGLTMVRLPNGGKVSVYLNGEVIQLNGNEAIDLHEPFRVQLQNYFSKSLSFKKSKNEVLLKYIGEDPNKIIGVDFFWLKDKN